MHGDGTVDDVLAQELVHLLVAGLVVVNVDGRDALMLERTDVVHVDATLGGGDGRGHGVLLAMLAAHAREGNLGPRAEGSALEAIGHLHEGLGDSLLEIAHR